MGGGGGTVVLETERMTLHRPDAERDFALYRDIGADPETMRFLGGRTQDENQAWRFLASVIGHWAIRGYGFFTCIERESLTPMGRIGPWYPHGWPGPEIGWTLRPGWQGRGYALEAARACRDHVFAAHDQGGLGWERVCHVIVEGNTASARLAERIGSTRTGTLPGIPGVSEEPCWVYGQEAPK